VQDSTDASSRTRESSSKCLASLYYMSLSFLLFLPQCITRMSRCQIPVVELDRSKHSYDPGGHISLWKVRQAPIHHISDLRIISRILFGTIRRQEERLGEMGWNEVWRKDPPPQTIFLVLGEVSGTPEDVPCCQRCVSADKTP
jgi:hypothetical protein